MIKDVMGATTLPVMAKSRIGHFYESNPNPDPNPNPNPNPNP